MPIGKNFRRGREVGEACWVIDCPQCGQSYSIGLWGTVGIEYREYRKVREINPPPYWCKKCGELIELPVSLDELCPPSKLLTGTGTVEL